MTGIKFISLLLILLCSVPTFAPIQAVRSVSDASGTVADLPLKSEFTAHEAAAIVTNNDYSSKQWTIPKIMVPQAWQVTTGKPNVLIAVLDTGIDKEQEDLVGNVIAEVNFTDSKTTEDIYGHGTHIAGIIAAHGKNGAGIVGLAPDCRLMNVKVADDQGRFDSTVAARGIDWAVDNGAKVITMSLESTEPSPILEEAVNHAWNQGAVLIAAAGNIGSTKIVYPAYYSNCIAVAATDINDRVASWSSQCDWVDVAAPGVDIYSTLPGNDYGYRSGTSMSAAQVSGLAGLLFAVESDKNHNGFVNDEVRAAIENGCDSLNLCALKGRINAFHSVNNALILR